MDFLSLLLVLILSIVVHEVAHAWVALREGDDTAQRLGRITLNPLSHLDIMGSLLVPLALYFLADGMILGWAKPVPINPGKFRNYRSGDIKVSLAGVVSNVLLAVVFTFFIVLLLKIQMLVVGGDAALEFMIRMARLGIFINLILAVFNLIPIPPLDGSHVVYHLLPPRWGEIYRRTGRYGIILLLCLVFFYPPFFRFVLWPVFTFMGFADALIYDLSFLRG
jgi:Zn-dependent protease